MIVVSFYKGRMVDVEKYRSLKHYLKKQKEVGMIGKTIKPKKTFPFYKKVFKVKIKKLRNQLLLFEEGTEELKNKKHNPPE